VTTSAAPTHMTTVAAPGTRRVVAAANALVAGDKGLATGGRSVLFHAHCSVLLVHPTPRLRTISAGPTVRISL